MANPLGKSINKTRIMGMEQPDQILLLTTEIGGSVKYSMDVENPFRTEKVNHVEPTIQPTIVYFNQVIVPRHSDWEHFPLSSLDSGTDVPSSGRNIDNRTRMTPQVPIVTTIP